jgi:hypothetical protein
MAFQLSPGVNVSEIDLTTIVPAVGTTEAAFAGKFVWGPIDQIVSISSEVELVNTFGKPDSNTAIDFFTAANFLAYGRNLSVVRSPGVGMFNATSANTGLFIKNLTDFTQNYNSGANTYGQFAAKWAGDLGNSLKVSMWTGQNSTAFSSWVYSGYFDGVPGTSNYVANRLGKNDEVHIVVVDEDGRFSGTANTVLEKFAYVSAASDATRDDGSTNYYKNVINQASKYIWSLSHPESNSTSWGTIASNVTYGSSNVATTISLANGSYGSASAANLSSSYDKFKNADEIDVSLILTGAHGNVVATYVISNIAEFRKDCITFISPDLTDVVNATGSETTNAIATRNKLTSTSYAFFDCNWKYQFDKYNNTYRWVPLNGDIAGLCVKTDFERDPWFSPAGFNRGQVKNVTKLAWNPNKTDRDNLYKNGINPVVTFPGEGTILYGDKTLLSKPSAFDRINVRRLFIVLEKAIARAAKFSLFEFNDAFTRAQFVSLVEPFLRDVQGRRGIFDYRVVCDETNNTPEVIDRNEFIGDIYIKPARSINFIQLNFVAVRTGVSFDEIVGKF